MVEHGPCPDRDAPEHVTDTIETGKQIPGSAIGMKAIVISLLASRVENRFVFLLRIRALIQLQSCRAEGRTLSTS